jgi:hypothetical protein
MDTDNDYTITDTITLTGSSDYVTSANVLTTTATTSTYDLSSLTTSNITNITIGGPSWTNTAPTFASVTGTNGSGVLDLTGPNADIKLNGESLVTMLRGIEERLNILKPNQKLEDDWDQLRELGEAYRKLEAEIVEKQKMWDTLKKMPPPVIE